MFLTKVNLPSLERNLIFHLTSFLSVLQIIGFQTLVLDLATSGSPSYAEGKELCLHARI